MEKKWYENMSPKLTQTEHESKMRILAGNVPIPEKEELKRKYPDGMNFLDFLGLSKRSKL
jgi:hypothetical protein